MANEISNSDDMIDLRDVIARFEELESERNDLLDTLTNAGEECGASEDGSDEEAELDQAVHAAHDAFIKWCEENEAELKALQSLLSDLKGYGGDEQWRGDWYPITLIRYSYFKYYAQELCEDIGDVPAGFPHYIEIDWAATARNIQVDYSSVEFEGVTYWYH